MRSEELHGGLGMRLEELHGGLGMRLEELHGSLGKVDSQETCWDGRHSTIGNHHMPFSKQLLLRMSQY